MAMKKKVMFGLALAMILPIAAKPILVYNEDDSHFFSYTLVSLTPDPNQDIVIYRWYKKYEQTTRFQLFDAISRNSELMKEDARQNGLSEMAREGHGPGHKELDWKR